MEILTATVKGHATCSNQVMLLDALLLDELLSRDITSSKEHRCGDALSEQRASGQPGVVPERSRVSTDVATDDGTCLSEAF